MWVDLRRYHVARLMPSAFHGWVLAFDLASYWSRGIPPAVRRRIILAYRFRALRASLRWRFDMSIAPMVVILKYWRSVAVRVSSPASSSAFHRFRDVAAAKAMVATSLGFSQGARRSIHLLILDAGSPLDAAPAR